MSKVDLFSSLHKITKRNYIERFVKYDKATCAEIAKNFDKDYWDGERQYGYGGYKYDGRWKPIAEKIIQQYELKDNDSILDAGCGKGFLLYELKTLLPDLQIKGFDISQYAITNAKIEIQPYIERLSLSEDLPFCNQSFDLVLSINVLHNLHIYELKQALNEIERVSKRKGYIVVESYRNEQEKANLLCWQLTCECFYTPDEWQWLFKHFGYKGDYSFIFFE